MNVQLQNDAHYFDFPKHEEVQQIQPITKVSDHQQTRKYCNKKCGYFCNHTQKTLCNCCPKSLRPQFCNCICFVYIFICVCIFFAIMIIIVIFVILPAIFSPIFQNVYIQLFSYSIHEKLELSPFYFNGTGELIAEIKNPNFISVALHEWNFTAISRNTHHLQEQWGTAHCCGKQNYWNADRHYRPNISYPYDVEVQISAHSIGNISLILLAPFIPEDMIDLLVEIRDGLMPIDLHGYGYIKILHTRFDFHAFLDCAFILNTSLMRRLVGRKKVGFDSQYMQFNYTSSIMQNDTQGYEFMPSLSPFSIVRTNRPSYRFMPKTNVWGKFPVVNQSCSIGIMGVRFT